MRLAGRLAALERRLAPLVVPDAVAAHPLPDLAGATAEAIVVALFDAIEAAHGAAGDEADGATFQCAACVATIHLAEAHALTGQTEPPWPPPLLGPFEVECAWRLELQRWRSLPAATLDRTAWEANEARMRADGLHTDHYRGQIPPWVIVNEPAPTVPAKLTRKRSERATP